MKKILIILNGATIVLLLVRYYGAVEEGRIQEAQKQEMGTQLLNCADDLTECTGYCNREAAAAFERGNQLFECAEDICRTNGWEPPEDHPTRAEWESKVKVGDVEAEATTFGPPQPLVWDEVTGRSSKLEDHR